MTQENQIEINWMPLTTAGILKVTLPEITVKFLNELSDVVLSDDPNFNNLDMDYRLAGKIREGKQRAIPIINESKVMSNFITFSHNLCLEYINTYLHYGNDRTRSIWSETPSVEIYEFWVNEQLANDYNPIHNHTQPFAALSSVAYLKIPEQIINNPDDDGAIKFIWSDRGNPYMLEYPGMLTIEPKVGDYYIFPSWLIHEVHPFRGEGVRRSISWNAKVWT